MKLEPVRDWLNGIALIPRQPDSLIIDPNAKDGSRFYLIETVSPEAAAAGYAPGDLVLGHHVWNILLYNGSFHRVKIQVSEIMDRVYDVTLEEFTHVGGMPLNIDAALIAAFEERKAFHDNRRGHT